MDRRLFLFTQQYAVPWDWTDLHTSRSSRAFHDLSLLTPPAVLGLSMISACRHLPRWTTTLQPRRPVSLLGLLAPPVVDKSHAHSSPNLPRYADRPVSLPTAHQSNTLASPNSPIHTANETCIISTSWLLFSGYLRPMHAVRTICDAREPPGSL